jgi:hypothetical protein
LRRARSGIAALIKRHLLWWQTSRFNLHRLQLSSHPQNALAVNALGALSALALRNDELRK